MSGKNCNAREENASNKKINPDGVKTDCIMFRKKNGEPYCSGLNALY